MKLSSTCSYAIQVFILIKNYQDTGLDIYELNYSKYQIELIALFTDLGNMFNEYVAASFKLETILANKDLISIYLK